MNKSISIVSLVVALVVVLGVGVGLGYFMAKGKAKTPSVAQTQVDTGIKKELTSTLVKYVSVLGQIKSVNTTTMVLTNTIDTMTIKVKAGAPVYQAKDGKQQKVSPVDLRIGQTVNASTTMLPSGELQATGIVILSAASK